MKSLWSTVLEIKLLKWLGRPLLSSERFSRCGYDVVSQSFMFDLLHVCPREMFIKKGFHGNVFIMVSEKKREVGKFWLPKRLPKLNEPSCWEQTSDNELEQLWAPWCEWQTMTTCCVEHLFTAFDYRICKKRRNLSTSNWYLFGLSVISLWASDTERVTMSWYFNHNKVNLISPRNFW